MRIGLFLPQLRMDIATIIERVQAAERAGVHSVWLMDHLAAPAMPEADVFEAWTLAAAIACRTEVIRVGHLVGADPFRHPAVLAKMAVTVDHLSGGRLDLGLGWGSMDAEMATFGITDASRRQRADRLRETLEVLPQLFSGQPVTYAGAHHRLDGAVCRPTPVQDAIPVHIGGAGEQLTMPLVRDHADWWNCPSYAIERLTQLRELAGDARISTQHPVGFVTDETDRRDVTDTAQRRFGAWGGLLTGNAEELRDALGQEADLGVELAIVQLTDFARPETLEAFGEQVVARL